MKYLIAIAFLILAQHLYASPPEGTHNKSQKIDTTAASKSRTPQNYKSDHTGSSVDLKKADEIAREVSAWFQYTTGVMKIDRLGQCGDYALMFALKYNAFAKANVARLVVANNPVTSGTYRIGEKTDVDKLGFHGFSSGASGFLNWNGQLYLYHPIIGAYAIYLERAWTPAKHFGVDMHDKKQVHVWAAVGETSIDPTYFALWPNKYTSPIGKDE